MPRWPNSERKLRQTLLNILHAVDQLGKASGGRCRASDIAFVTVVKVTSIRSYILWLVKAELVVRDEKTKFYSNFSLTTRGHQVVKGQLYLIYRKKKVTVTTEGTYREEPLPVFNVDLPPDIEANEVRYTGRHAATARLYKVLACCHRLNLSKDYSSLRDVVRVTGIAWSSVITDLKKLRDNDLAEMKGNRRGAEYGVTAAGVDVLEGRVVMTCRMGGLRLEPAPPTGNPDLALLPIQRENKPATVVPSPAVAVAQDGMRALTEFEKMTGRRQRAQAA